tara:strand:+ start:280 stop:1668 length:1389 start_codon:yes stop_codon:yes gene_type:complete
MHIHILGICGTFMGGLAVLANDAGYKVSGCDLNIYPPMSTLLLKKGIKIIEGFNSEQTKLNPDVYVIGNTISRGNPLIEEILNLNLNYISGPEWIRENILKKKWVIAVAGTHGKTTTSSILAWILEKAGFNPGFLIGGVPKNFGVSARLGSEKSGIDFFIIEADEYDTAFFDKRSKFLHFSAKTIILNNLEFDHADIFPDLNSIETQFHHFIKIIPSNSQLIVNAEERSLKNVLEKGVWSNVEMFNDLSKRGWYLSKNKDSSVDFFLGNEFQGKLEWSLIGSHNQLNALAAIAAARHCGVPAKKSIKFLSDFKSVKKRMEILDVVKGITIIDDFAHHPTAISKTLGGLREKVGTSRIIVILEIRSNTMRMGSLKDNLSTSLFEANLVFIYCSRVNNKKNINWDINFTFSSISEKIKVFSDLSKLNESLLKKVKTGDNILIMSNGSFEGIHQKIINFLKNKNF